MIQIKRTFDAEIDQQATAAVALPQTLLGLGHQALERGADPGKHWQWDSRLIRSERF